MIQFSQGVPSEYQGILDSLRKSIMANQIQPSNIPTFNAGQLMPTPMMRQPNNLTMLPSAMGGNQIAPNINSPMMSGPSSFQNTMPQQRGMNFNPSSYGGYFGRLFNQLGGMQGIQNLLRRRQNPWWSQYAKNL